MQNQYSCKTLEPRLVSFVVYDENLKRWLGQYIALVKEQGAVTMNSLRPNRALGRFIKELRVSGGLTQKELSKRSKVSVETLKNLEGGKNPTIGTLQLVLATLLETEPKELLLGILLQDKRLLELRERGRSTIESLLKESYRVLWMQLFRGFCL